ncbi:hypothetical protein C8R44DRAFT_981366 [Mycena epipterygia]|nr:hypothetical protein C8R44DRAFT_981366 [Mycena epipterygia]
MLQFAPFSAFLWFKFIIHLGAAPRFRGHFASTIDLYVQASSFDVKESRGICTFLNFLVNITFPDDFPDRVGRREHGAAQALRVLDDVDPQHAG